MMLLQIWLVRLALVALALLCFAFGGLTARKGFRSHQLGNIDDKIQGPAARAFSAEAVFLGSFVFLFGFALLYLLTMF